MGDYLSNANCFCDDIFNCGSSDEYLIPESLNSSSDKKACPDKCKVTKSRKLVKTDNHQQLGHLVGYFSEGKASLQRYLQGTQSTVITPEPGTSSSSLTVTNTISVTVDSVIAAYILL
jgi:hypothetical protein